MTMTPVNIDEKFRNNYITVDPRRSPCASWTYDSRCTTNSSQTYPTCARRTRTS